MDPTPRDGQPGRATLDSVVVTGCTLDSAPVHSFLRALDQPRAAWATGELTIAAGGAVTTITASGADRFADVRDRARALFNGLRQDGELPHTARPRLVGGFSFTESHDAQPGEPWEGYPAGQFILPEVQLTVTDEDIWLTATAGGPGAREAARDRLQEWQDRLATLPDVTANGPPGIRDQQYNPSNETWRRQVDAAMERIRSGRLEKVVLAQSLTATLAEPISVTDVLTRLGDPYPGCYRFLFDPPTGGAFFGATPERLVTVDGTAVETEALAGSIGRGETSAADDRLADELRNSEKDRHEHSLVVEALRDQLATHAADIQPGERSVRRLANVQHLETPVRARLDDETHVLSLVEALHPTPAVGGLPPTAALETIHETESFDRGWYAAPVGWFDADGNGTFAVAIRSGIAREETATLFAGAGIVADSDPDGEWAELQLKYRPILDELA